MRNIATKADDVGDTLPAAAFNSDQDELENAVTSADITLDPNAGPDTDLNMLGKTMAAYANAANVYQDSGAADAYVLSIASNLKSVTKYYDNMMIVFKAGNANTGASTVNVATLGVKSITLPDGTALSAGKIATGAYVIANYNLSSDRFELVAGSTIDIGQTVQVVHQEHVAATVVGGTALPVDNTIPQSNEGDEIFTASITPTSATNKLFIEILLNWSTDDSTDPVSVAVFQDAVANALQAWQLGETQDTNDMQVASLAFEIDAGTTSPTTIKIRIGNITGVANVNINRTSAIAAIFGGVMKSWMRITEVEA